MPKTKRKAPCHHLITTANARKQIKAATALIADHPEMFGNMTFTDTFSDGGKLTNGSYRDSQGFYITGSEDIHGYHRELYIGQNGYGLHCRYVVTPKSGMSTILWVGIAQTTAISDFAEALKELLVKREVELAKLRAAL